MGIPNYSVVKGDPEGKGAISGTNPHYRFELDAGDSGEIEVDVNVQSSDGSEILYLIVESFTPPDVDGLVNLPSGRTPLNTGDSDLRIDYVQEKNADGTPLVNPAQFQKLDLGDSTMQDAVEDLLDQALSDPNGLIYVFGSYFQDANGVMGIDNIHMNQGNPPGNFEKDNGSWQDGAIFLQLPSQGTAAQWKALFIRFQTQTFPANALKTAT
jgi:uncharacterized protein YukJ